MYTLYLNLPVKIGLTYDVDPQFLENWYDSNRH